MWNPGQIPENLIFLITVTPKREAVRMTALEARTVRLIALGCNDHQAAAIIGRSVAAIRQAKARALRKTGVETPTALGGWAIEHGLCRAEDRLSPSQRQWLLETEQGGAPGPAS